MSVPWLKRLQTYLQMATFLIFIMEKPIWSMWLWYKYIYILWNNKTQCTTRLFWLTLWYLYSCNFSYVYLSPLTDWFIMYITWNITVVIEPANLECYTRTNYIKIVRNYIIIIIIWRPSFALQTNERLIRW